MQELKVLVEKYHAVFYVNTRGGVNIKVYDKNVEMNEEETDELENTIRIPDSFDENELEELLTQSSNIVKQMNEDYNRC